MKFLSLAIVLLVAISLGIGLIAKNRLDVSTPVAKYTPIEKSHSTVYVPAHNGTNIVVLHLKNPGLSNQDQYRIRLLTNSSTVYEQNFSGFNVGDPSDLRIQFAPLDLAGNSVTIELQPISSNSGSPLSVGVDDNGNLAFDLFYRSNDILMTLNQVMQKIVQDQIFLLQWGSLLLLLILYEKQKSN